MGAANFGIESSRLLELSLIRFNLVMDLIMTKQHLLLPSTVGSPFRTPSLLDTHEIQGEGAYF